MVVKTLGKVKPVTRFEALPLDEAVAKLKEYLKQGIAAHWSAGEIYNHLIDKRIPEKAGFRNAKDFFVKNFGEVGQSSLSIYGAVQRRFTVEIAQKYGMTTLGKLATYLKEANVPFELGEDPGPLKIPVPQKAGPTVEKAFADCTKEDMIAALHGLKRKGGAKKPPAQDEQVVDRMHETLLNTLGADTRAAVKATIERGRTLVTISRIDLSEVPDVLTALLAAHQGDVDSSTDPSESSGSSSDASGLSDATQAPSEPSASSDGQTLAGPPWGLVPVLNPPQDSAGLVPPFPATAPSPWPQGEPVQPVTSSTAENLALALPRQGTTSGA